MESMNLLGALDHPAYRQRVKLRGYNGMVTLYQAHTDTDGARVLKKVHNWDAAAHLSLAVQHAMEALRQQDAWNALLEAAAQETFGRPYRVTDYRISGIACDEFSDEKKAALRFAAHAETKHRMASRAHAKAAVLLRRACR